MQHPAIVNLFIFFWRSFLLFKALVLIRLLKKSTKHWNVSKEVTSKGNISACISILIYLIIYLFSHVWYLTNIIYLFFFFSFKKYIFDESYKLKKIKKKKKKAFFSWQLDKFFWGPLIQLTNILFLFFFLFLTLSHWICSNLEANSNSLNVQTWK